MQYVNPYSLNLDVCQEGAFVKYILYLRGYMGPKHQTALCEIHKYGILRMRHATTKKQMGVMNLNQRAVSLSHAQQNKFCDWMDTKSWKATKDEIDLWDTSNTN